MELQSAIEAKLQESLSPSHLEVTNESHMHAVAPGAETHFRVLVVAKAFEGKPLVQRHRLIYQALEQERARGVHALGIQTLTPSEYEDASGVRLESPPCLGGDGKASDA